MDFFKKIKITVVAMAVVGLLFNFTNMLPKPIAIGSLATMAISIIVNGIQFIRQWQRAIKEFDAKLLDAMPMKYRQELQSTQ